MRAILAAVTATLITAVLVYLLWADEHVGSRRFNYEVVVEVNGKEYVGSTVWEQTTERPWNPLPGAMDRRSAKGEAIAIPISPTRVVFILKRHLETGGFAEFGALLVECGVYSPRELREFRGGCELPIDRQFILVARGELGGTALPQFERIDAQSRNSMSVSVVSARIQTTDAPVTSGLTATYPWIRTLPNTLMDLAAKGYPTTPAGRIFGVDFVSN